VVAIEQGELGAQVGGLFGRHEDVERRGGAITARALLAAHEHVEADGRITARRHQTDVLRFGMTAVLQAAGDRDVEFARQVREVAARLLTPRGPARIEPFEVTGAVQALDREVRDGGEADVAGTRV